MGIKVDDLIKRSDAIDAIMGQPPEPHYPSWYTEQIKKLPSAQPERKKGRWIDDCTCSKCLWTHEDSKGFALITNYNFCPNCGSPMAKGESDGRT